MMHQIHVYQQFVPFPSISLLLFLYSLSQIFWVSPTLWICLSNNLGSFNVNPTSKATSSRFASLRARHPCFLPLPKETSKSKSTKCHEICRVKASNHHIQNPHPRHLCTPCMGRLWAIAYTAIVAAVWRCWNRSDLYGPHRRFRSCGRSCGSIFLLCFRFLSGCCLRGERFHISSCKVSSNGNCYP